MHGIILNLIVIIHIIFILFILITPFTNSNYLLFLHIIICPFMMIHWILNDNTCALTLFEKYVRKHINGGSSIKDEDCFTCRIIDPIYKFTNNFANQSTVAYIVVIFLWFYSMFKLYNKYSIGEIASIFDLAKL